jgi:hypothetical protein
LFNYYLNNVNDKFLLLFQTKPHNAIVNSLTVSFETGNSNLSESFRSDISSPSPNQHSDDVKTELSNQKLEIDSFNVNALGMETVKPSLKSEINELSLLSCSDNSHNIRSKRDKILNLNTQSSKRDEDYLSSTQRFQFVTCESFPSSSMLPPNSFEMNNTLNEENRKNNIRVDSPHLKKSIQGKVYFYFLLLLLLLLYFFFLLLLLVMKIVCSIF